jgi:hypothetical protein
MECDLARLGSYSVTSLKVKEDHEAREKSPFLQADLTKSHSAASTIREHVLRIEQNAEDIPAQNIIWYAAARKSAMMMCIDSLTAWVWISLPPNSTQTGTMRGTPDVIAWRPVEIDAWSHA